MSGMGRDGTPSGRGAPVRPSAAEAAARGAGEAAADELERRRWRVLAVTSVGIFMVPFDQTVVSVALPQMGAQLHLTFVDALWVQAAYALVVAVALIPAGRLADATGGLRLFRLGVLIFTLASVLAALSPDGRWLLTARCLQGAGGALLSATATALVSAAFPAHQRGRALGLNVTAVYLGLAVGPVAGGLLTQALGWRSIFFVSLPVGAATLIAGGGLAGGRGEGRMRPDLAGTALFALALSMGMIGLTFGPVWGWRAPGTLGLLAAGALLLAAFVAVEARIPEPLLDLGMFRRSRVFAAANLAALANYIALTAVTVLTSVFIEVAMGRSAREAGLLLTVQPLFMAGLSSTAGRLSDRVGSRWLASGGMLAIAAGLASLATLPAGRGLVRLEATLALIGAGMAAFSSPNTSAVVGSVERQRLGVASATLGTMRWLGQALSIAVLGAVATSRLGPGGQMLIFTGRGGPGTAAAYVDGFHLAMAAGVAIALAGAAASLARGPARGAT
jgi:EmrB/QacA subfamily drug resistance transporter